MVEGVRDGQGAGDWATTRWSVVVAVGCTDEAARRRSLELLCRQYWQPVYRFLGQVLGLDGQEAEDLTQEFFVFMLDRDVISRADPALGRFRSYVRTVLRNFVTDRKRFESRLRRGGGRKIVSMDLAAERGVAFPVDPGESAERILDRRWARRLIELAVQRLEIDLDECGRSSDFALFRDYLSGKERVEAPTYRELGEAHDLSDWQVWKKLKDLRERLRLAITREVARTVSDPAHVESELAVLLELLD